MKWSWMHTALVVCGGVVSEAPKLEALLPPLGAQILAVVAQLAASGCVVLGLLSGQVTGSAPGEMKDQAQK